MMNGTRWLRHPFVISGLALGGLGLLSLLPETGGESGSFVMLRLSLALIAIVALALAAIPFLKKVPVGSHGERRRLRCVEQLSLGSRQRIALIAVDDRELLVSLQTDGCRLLSDLCETAAATKVTADSVEIGESKKLATLNAAPGRRGSF
jgi:flagellar biogenesis protein FliO